MTLVCDGCEDDIDAQRPTSAIPLPGDNVIDLCSDCNATLSTYMTGEIDDVVPNVYRGEITIEITKDAVEAHEEGELVD